MAEADMSGLVLGDALEPSLDGLELGEPDLSALAGPDDSLLAPSAHLPAASTLQDPQLPDDLLEADLEGVAPPGLLLDATDLPAPSLEEPDVGGAALVPVTRYLGSADEEAAAPPPVSAAPSTPQAAGNVRRGPSRVKQPAPRLQIPPEAAQKMAEGMQAYSAPLAAMQQRLLELSTTQGQLLQLVQQEYEKFSHFPEEVQAAADTFKRVPEYQAKIVQLQKNMKLLSSIVEKSKARSLALKMRKISDEKDEQERQKKQLEKEKMLLAKPAESLLRSDE